MGTVKSILRNPITLVIMVAFLIHVLFLVKNPGDNFYFPHLYSEELVNRFGPGIVQYGSYDATFYAKAAEQLLYEGILGYNSEQPNAYVTPGLPIYLACTFALADLVHIDHSLMAKIFNLLLSVGTIYIVYLICKETFSRRIGLIAAVVHTFYFPIMHYFRTLLTETPSMFFFYLSVYLFVMCLKTNKKFFHIIFGIIFSISLMIRPNQAPLILIPIYLVIKKFGVKESFKIALLWLIGPLLIILPWIIRNAIQLNEFVLFSTQSNPLFAGSNPFFLEDYNLMLQNLQNSGMSESEYAILRIKEGFRSNPILWINWFLFGKTMYLFNHPSGWYNYITNYGYLTPLVKIYHFSILFIGVGISIISKNKKVRIIFSSLLVYVGFCNLFLPNDRYGFFIYPFLIILFSYAINAVINKLLPRFSSKVSDEASEVNNENNTQKPKSTIELLKSSHLIQFSKEIIKQRNIIFELAKKDFKSRYLGSYLGVFWAFIQPTLLVIIYWFVFQVGFRSTPIENFPFILWLLAGIIPWFYFSDSLASAVSSIEQNSYLVKKVVFNVFFLPIVKIVTSMIVHSVFIVILFTVYFSYGQPISIYQFQIIYYSFAVTLFLTGLSWIVASLNVFLKDISQIVTVVLQFGFWLTPIFWTFSLVPNNLHWLFKLNPIYYIVEGYRDSFINQVWFWEHPYLTIYFWVLTILMLFVGAKLFKKLSPHFSDVL
ncbi:ABC transporter permease [Paenibacillus woosongensis]|uniref:Transport permease protein n=1 Tax=Paenibacillus woosongensis TaxID=307580 RepID=A0A7X2Z464_9BACL|nr:ABC transporter permease [Paenibacillus woosongensis]MUG47197.1 hypothetical protein [Paenibacillus woosongensis]